MKAAEKRLEYYRKQCEVADIARAARELMLKDRGISPASWHTNKNLCEERAIIAWITIELLGETANLAAVTVDRSRPTAAGLFENAKASPEIQQAADRYYQSVTQRGAA